MTWQCSVPEPAPPTCLRSAGRGAEGAATQAVRGPHLSDVGVVHVEDVIVERCDHGRRESIAVFRLNTPVKVCCLIAPAASAVLLVSRYQVPLARPPFRPPRRSGSAGLEALARDERLVRGPLLLDDDAPVGVRGAGHPRPRVDDDRLAHVGMRELNVRHVRNAAAGREEAAGRPARRRCRPGGEAGRRGAVVVDDHRDPRAVLSPRAGRRRRHRRRRSGVGAGGRPSPRPCIRAPRRSPAFGRHPRCRAYRSRGTEWGRCVAGRGIEVEPAREARAVDLLAEDARGPARAAASPGTSCPGSGSARSRRC